ncbi:LacI family DNA-binding transcriptional regulator [soil metagenome]
MLPTDTKHATLLDVAKAAGVSHQTVSRVVNNHPHVAVKTRDRVLSSIRKLGYQPNRMARGLATSSTQTIGLVSFGVSYFGPAQMLVSIEKVIRDSGYDLTFATLEAPDLKALRRAVDKLSGSGVDGVVVIAPVIGLDARQLADLHTDLPIVMTDVQVGAKIHSVILDQREGSRLATQHLIDLGHTRIAEISGPLNWNDAALRHEGWLETLQRANLTPGATAAGDWSARAGYEAALELLQGASGFTGLVVGNDQMALGALRALGDSGLKVPDDVSVVGFDDSPEAPFFGPPLTTVQQDFAVMGRQSIEHLLALIAQPGTPVSQRILYPRLMVRSSTAAPPVSSKS